MALLKPSFGQELPLHVRTAGLWLRPLQMCDYNQWAGLRALSREHLTKWEPAWGGDELSRNSFRRRVRHYAREASEDLGYAFAIFNAQGDTLLGGITLSNVSRGVSQAATLGYWMGKPFVRQGTMSRAVTAIFAFAYEELRLHRLQAVTMPDNAASVKLLESRGFIREGFARKYLKINGQWQDHVIFAMLADDWRAHGEPRS